MCWHRAQDAPRVLEQLKRAITSVGDRSYQFEVFDPIDCSWAGDVQRKTGCRESYFSGENEAPKDHVGGGSEHFRTGHKHVKLLKELELQNEAPKNHVGGGSEHFRTGHK